MTKKEYVEDYCKRCNLCDGSEYHQYHCPDTDTVEEAWEACREQTINDVCDYIKNNIDPKLIIYHENTWCNIDGFIAGMRKELEL